MSKQKILILLTAGIFVLAGLGLFLYADGPCPGNATNCVTGTDSGSNVNGVTIKALQNGTEVKSATTNGSGQYCIDGLTANQSYTIKCDSCNFPNEQTVTISSTNCVQVNFQK